VACYGASGEIDVDFTRNEQFAGFFGWSSDCISAGGSDTLYGAGNGVCDRYRLDTAMFAAMVTLSTLLRMLMLPFWFLLWGV